MKKYDKIRKLNYDEYSTFDSKEIVIVQEKIDGANFRCWRNEDNIVEFGSRNIEFGLQTKNYNKYQKAVDYILEKENDIISGYVYFFEAMIKHTVEYDTDIPCYLIDIYSLTTDQYISPIAYNGVTNLPFVKNIFKGLFEDYKFDPQLITNYNKDKFDIKMEGVVIKSATNLNKRAKIVNEKYKEQKFKNLCGTGENRTGGEVAFIDQFVTEARINKCIFKLQDKLSENKKVDIKFIAVIINDILYDIITEEFKKFLKIGSSININLLKTHITYKVKDILLNKKKDL